MLIDCHQHLWPERLVDALRRRTTYPYLRGWTLYLPGEPPYEVDPHAHDVEARRTREIAEGKESVILSISSPLGMEYLESAELLDVWHESGLALGDPYRIWASAHVAEPDPDGLAKVLVEDRVAGVQLPATALAEPAAIERLGPLLQEAERAGKPVLVHPGPAPACDPEVPSWWPAMVPYVAQMHSAWLAWHVAGRRQHPLLRIAFVALAGLAPLHHERLSARGGALGPLDPYVYYETSSYGTRAIDALTRVVGVDPLVHGSDRPYAEPADPGLGDAFRHALFTANPRHLLTGEPR
ncbi:hypothetical protein Ade02nite_80420 [Paractinoplanes deccanensis]|uniref:Amidohydrolase n=1 Tax=Paractinoplanes deccanensis TaxID=113561 RepID=A0ABQ3YHB3_9ACTN|nr:amidohydrolase family protein [Actinoplanes deccanensis]GID79401.1 hypothetical protein Ade02nite_80420 [Actinoplanes deccanensis]